MNSTVYAQLNIAPSANAVVYNVHTNMVKAEGLWRREWGNGSGKGGSTGYELPHAHKYFYFEWLPGSRSITR